MNNTKYKIVDLKFENSPTTARWPLTRLPILGDTKLSLSLLVPNNGLGLLLGGGCSTKSP